MASIRQLEANKKNALRSCGPRSLEGKLRSRSNAYQHGLATKIGSTEAERRRIDRIASELAAWNQRYFGARYVAESQIHLESVKAATALVLQRLTTSSIDDREQFDLALDLLRGLGSYERKARSRRKRAIRDLRSSFPPNIA